MTLKELQTIVKKIAEYLVFKIINFCLDIIDLWKKWKNEEKNNPEIVPLCQECYKNSVEDSNYPISFLPCPIHSKQYDINTITNNRKKGS